MIFILRAFSHIIFFIDIHVTAKTFWPKFCCILRGSRSPMGWSDTSTMVGGWGGGGHKEKACCEAFVCELCKSPHYTNLFFPSSLTRHNLGSLETLQSKQGEKKITRGKRSQLLLLFLFFQEVKAFCIKVTCSHIHKSHVSINAETKIFFAVLLKQ